MTILSEPVVESGDCSVLSSVDSSLYVGSSVNKYVCLLLLSVKLSVNISEKKLVCTSDIISVDWTVMLSVSKSVDWFVILSVSK